MSRIKIENSDEFDIEFEVMPDYKLPDYKKNNKLKTEKYIANDTDINEAINNLQNQFAQAKTVDGKIKTGQFVYGDFDKFIFSCNNISCWDSSICMCC